MRLVTGVCDECFRQCVGVSFVPWSEEVIFCRECLEEAVEMCKSKNNLTLVENKDTISI